MVQAAAFQRQIFGQFQQLSAGTLDLSQVSSPGSAVVPTQSSRPSHPSQAQAQSQLQAQAHAQAQAQARAQVQAQAQTQVQAQAQTQAQTQAQAQAQAQVQAQVQTQAPSPPRSAAASAAAEAAEGILGKKQSREEDVAIERSVPPKKHAKQARLRAAREQAAAAEQDDGESEEPPEPPESVDEEARGVKRSRADGALEAALENTERPIRSGNWNFDEDKQLTQVVEENGAKEWKKICSLVAGGKFSDVQCLHRWNKVLKPGLRKGPWSLQEDEVVKELVHVRDDT